MQAPSALRDRLDLFAERPTVGALMTLCEENYGALLRLAPTLPALGGQRRSQAPGAIDLLLEVFEQSRYTTTLHLTHPFSEPGAARSAPRAGLRLASALAAAGPPGARPPGAEPDALLRAYHDAGQVEVLDLRQTVLPLFTHYCAPALEAKWRANLFLAKWLGYCLRVGHRFPAHPLAPQPTSRRAAFVAS